MKKVTIFLFALLLSLTTAGTALAWGGGPAQVRVLHASPDAPPVNVLIDGRLVFSSLCFGQTSQYLRLEPGDYNVKVVTADRAQLVVIDANITVAEGQAYTVAAVGFASAIEPLVLVDTTEAPGASQAKIRVVHASPNGPAVDVVTSQGDVLFANVPFKGVTEFLAVERGLYHVQVKPTGGGDIVLDIPWLPLHPGSARTILVLGLVNDNPALGYTMLASPVVQASAPCNPCAPPPSRPPQPPAQPCNPCWQAPPPRPAPCCGSDTQSPWQNWQPYNRWPWPYHPMNYYNPQFGELPYRAYVTPQFVSGW
ncbi:MAG: hypothetical protein Kow0031_34530 [Anaerolineae bacterium]